MTKDQINEVLERVRTWPEDRQRELAEVALEIEAELASDGYEATPDELAVIDDGLAGEAASAGEAEVAFTPFGALSGENPGGPCVVVGYDPLANSVVLNRTSIPGVWCPSVSSGTRFVR
jgi:hypothetical protein